MDLQKSREFISSVIEKNDKLEHGKAGDVLKKIYGTLSSMYNSPIYFWNVPNKIKDRDGGYWILQKKVWHTNRTGVTATYKHSITGKITTEGYTNTSQQTIWR